MAILHVCMLMQLAFHVALDMEKGKDIKIINPLTIKIAPGEQLIFVLITDKYNMLQLPV